MPATKSAKLTATEMKRRVLLAGDWFCNTQVVQASPQWDANHGRVVYTYHLPTKNLVLGLSWSQGRAIMCLLGAHELNGQQKYFDAAVRCGSYLVHALQRMDARDKRTYGAFAEEVPTSRFSFPRDGIEAAFGLLQLHLATGCTFYLDRCELFAKWYVRNAYHADAKWVAGRVGFDDTADHVKYSYIQAGGAPFFWHLHQLTGNARYKSMVRMLGDGMLERFIEPTSGAITSGRVVKKMAGHSHHATVVGGKELVFNDDGSMIGLTCAHSATGRKTSKYLDAAVRYGDWLLNDCARPSPAFAADGLHAINLCELTDLTGEGKYRKFAADLMAEQVKLQVESPKQLDRHGAYRGEDEPAHYYGPADAKGRDFVNTRTTAYSTLALLRLGGKVVGPAYSALGFHKPRKMANPHHG